MAHMSETLADHAFMCRAVRRWFKQRSLWRHIGTRGSLGIQPDNTRGRLNVTALSASLRHLVAPGTLHRSAARKRLRRSGM